MNSRKWTIVAVVAVTLSAAAGWTVGVIEDGKPPKTVGQPPEVPIAWEASVDAALARAREDKTPVLIEFYQSWQQWCHMLEEKTLSDAEIAKMARHFACARVDADKAKDLLAKYEVKDCPTLLFLNSRGERIHRVVGFIPPRPLEFEMKEIAKGREPEKELAKLEQSNPTEFKPLVMLGVGYLRRQEWNKAIATYERALNVGPGMDATEQQEVIYSLCQLYDHAKRPEKAERLLRELLRAENCDKVKVHDMLGHVYLTMKRPNEAITHFTAERNLVEDQKQREYLDRFLKHIQASVQRKK